MLALTYPDGARVQRCDYLPENWPIQRLVYPGLSLLNEIVPESNPGIDYTPRFQRRRSRRGTDHPVRRKNRKIRNDDGIEIPEDVPPSPLRYDTADDNRQDNELERDRESSQFAARSADYQTQRLPIFDVDERPRLSNDQRLRRELPGRESWPGGRHPKDRCCFLHLLLILVLIIIGYNRHSGPFGSRANRTVLGVFAFGTVVGGGDSAPVDIAPDSGIRSERSANLSHITGTSRKIQMYIKHRHLQILPDGTVNGSNDDTSDYTVLQRASVSRGQLRIQGVATCLYLCMDSCGLLYGSREYTEDCVFNETLEQHNYNTYSSAHWSTPRKTLYLGLSGRGQPRRVQVHGHNLGRLSAYARVLTQVVAPDRVEALHRRMMGTKHNVRHHHGSQQSICPTLTPQEKDGRDKFRCRKRKKRKKRRRKCRPGESPGPQCDVRENGAGTEAQSKRSCEGAAVEEACRREALDAPSKKRKSRIEEDEASDDAQEEEVVAEGKSRRSNDRGVKKKGRKPEGPALGVPGKKSGGKRKKTGKGDRGTSKSLKKRGNNHSTGRFARTTNRLVATSPISWFAEPTSATLVGQPPTQEAAQSRESGPGLFSERPKSLSSSSSTVSAVSLAATSLASTLTLTVASAEVFHSEESGARAEKTESVLDLEELADVKEFEDEEEEERDEEEEEDRDEGRTDFKNFRAARGGDGEPERRLAM